MLLVFLSIPLMILAVAIATVPLVLAMRKEAIEQRLATRARQDEPAVDEQLPLAA